MARDFLHMDQAPRSLCVSESFLESSWPHLKVNEEEKAWLRCTLGENAMKLTKSTHTGQSGLFAPLFVYLSAHSFASSALRTLVTRSAAPHSFSPSLTNFPPRSWERGFLSKIEFVDFMQFQPTEH